MIRFAYIEGKAFRHGDIVRIISFKSIKSPCSSFDRKTFLQRSSNVVEDLLLEVLSARDLRLVASISNEFTLGMYSYISSSNFM